MHQRLLTTATICTRSSHCLVLNTTVTPTGTIARIGCSHIDTTTSMIKRCKQTKTVEYLHQLNVAVVTCKAFCNIRDCIRLLPHLDMSPQAQHDHFRCRCHCDWQCSRLTAAALLPERCVAVPIDEHCIWTSCSGTESTESDLREGFYMPAHALHIALCLKGGS